LSEIIFFYFLDQGTLRFPENMLVPVIVLSVGFVLIARYASLVTAILTFYTSALAIILIIDWFHGNSADPSILRDYLGITFSDGQQGQGIANDFIIIGLAGGSVWMIFLSAFQSTVHKMRNMSIKDIRFPLRSSISKLTKFFDKHPWLATILMSVITLLIGLVIGGIGK